MLDFQQIDVPLAQLRLVHPNFLLTQHLFRIHVGVVKLLERITPALRVLEPFTLLHSVLRVFSCDR